MNGTQHHICILCSRLDQPGGIERAIVNTANLLQSKGYKISILVLDITNRSFFPLHDEINIYQENLHFGITPKGNPLWRKLVFLQHIYQLKKKIKSLQPSSVITTEYPFTIAAALAMAKLSCKVFAWEHHQFQHLEKNRFWKGLQKRFYPRTTAVICLNKDEAAFFQSMGCRTAVIPNFTERQQRANLQSKTLLTVGWLSKTKGIDVLPAIAEEIVKRHPDWQWKIIGTGDEEKDFKNELKKRGLLNHVEVIQPNSPNLADQYLSSALYVMLSRFECFPMVLLEAMSHGVPCIAFDCPTGPRHIITNGEDGVLVTPSETASMVGAISSLIINVERRTKLGRNAYHNTSRFSAENIYPLWEKLFV